MKKIRVHCYQKGTHIMLYEFGVEEPLNAAAVAPPTTQSLESEAKSNLTTEGLAFPPYADITFKID